jgi:hypothetical protein
MSKKQGRETKLGKRGRGEREKRKNKGQETSKI